MVFISLKNYPLTDGKKFFSRADNPINSHMTKLAISSFDFLFFFRLYHWDILFLILKPYCDTMKGVRQADDLFVCFGAKPNKGLSSRSSTRPEVWEERSWKRNLERSVGKRDQERAVGRGTQRRNLAKSDAEGQSTMVSREGRPVMMSWHCS